MASTAYSVEEYPSLVWVAVPSLVLVSAYFVRKWYKAYQLRVYGIGKGAPGFQTGVKRLRVTPDVAARIRRGEDVSPEEIAESARKMEELERTGKKPPLPTIYMEDEKQFVPPPPSDDDESSGKKNGKEISEEMNEWLPDSVKGGAKKRKGKKK